MSRKSYNDQLYEKMIAEQDEYREWLLSKEPEEILKYAYKFYMREAILAIMEENNSPYALAKSLLKSKHPLFEIFKTFSEIEDNVRLVDLVWESVRDCAYKFVWMTDEQIELEDDFESSILR